MVRVSEHLGKQRSVLGAVLWSHAGVTANMVLPPGLASPPTRCHPGQQRPVGTGWGCQGPGVGGSRRSVPFCHSPWSTQGCWPGGVQESTQRLFVPHPGHTQGPWPTQSLGSRPCLSGPGLQGCWGPLSHQVEQGPPASGGCFRPCARGSCCRKPAQSWSRHRPDPSLPSVCLSFAAHSARAS